MASINDVFNQLVAVNAALNQIHTDNIAETNATSQVKTSVDALDADTKAGFATTLNGLQVIEQIDTEAVNLIFHLTQQADTIICALEQISKNTCQILTQITIQTELQKYLRDDVSVLKYVQESENPKAVLERQRFNEMQAEIERCCPPKEPTPACSYEPCPKPPSVRMPDLPHINNQ